MKLWNHYYTPASVEEAIDLLGRYAGEARIVAGGTDLLIEMKESHHDPIEALIDITSIPDLRMIEEIDSFAYIGAGVTHTQIVKSALLANHATCLVESCGVVGGPQVRNVATLGGNVAHALPAGDGTTSLVALDAEVEIYYQGQRQWVPILQMYKGPGISLLDSTRDLLMRFRFRLCGEREGAAFKRIMRPQGVALPILGCAVWVKVDGSRSYYEDARISIAPVGPTPQRITEAENALKGQPVGEFAVGQAVEAALSTIRPRTSKYRATAEYRKEMINVLLRRTLPLAAQRAQSGQAVPEGVGV